VAFQGHELTPNIDLNLVAAGIAEVPETSDHTSIKQRIEHAKHCDKLEALKAARLGTVAGSKAAGTFEQSHWLVPVEDRRQLAGVRNANAREGMLDSFSLGSYLLLVEYTGRLFRNGKARINEGVKDVLDRLGTSVEYWNDRIKKMLVSRELRGCCFGCKPETVIGYASHRGKRQSNLSPQLAAG
jgi:hypothetical protein